MLGYVLVKGICCRDGGRKRAAVVFGLSSHVKGKDFLKMPGTTAVLSLLMLVKSRKRSRIGHGKGDGELVSMRSWRVR